MKKMLPAAAAVLVLVLAGRADAAEEKWSYGGKTCPNHWAKLDPAYALCGQGANQSPVDLTGCIKAELEPLKFDYTGLITTVRRGAHSVEADHSAGSYLRLSGRKFELRHIAFHAPSEHQVDGESFPLEAQLVHADEDGHLAVVAVLFTTGADNPELKKILQQIPKEAGQKEGMASQVRADSLLPEKRDYYRVNGSLTAPPCTEGVLWLVMKNPVAVSETQVKQFSDVLGGPNSRPVQPLNGRAALQ
jgi:carbonic anhydrase